MLDSWRARGTAHVFGDDIPHDGGIMARHLATGPIADTAELARHLFEEIDPGFRDRVKPGDFIVAGKNFGCGKPHTSGYIAMHSLGLRLVCESVPAGVARMLMNLCLPCLQPCEGIVKAVRTGDEIEVDYETGRIRNITVGTERLYRPLDANVREVIRRGGLRGTLLHWLKEHPELGEPGDG